MKIKHALLSFGILITLLSSLSLIAQSESRSPLESELKVYVVTINSEDEEALVATDTIEPGQIVEYQAIYRNVSEETLSTIRAIGPIPESTLYIGGSATEIDSVALEFSVDNGQSYSKPPLYITVINEETGESQKVEADPEDYNQLRWTIPSLEGGQEIELKYRVRVQ